MRGGWRTDFDAIPEQQLVLAVVDESYGHGPEVTVLTVSRLKNGKVVYYTSMWCEIIKHRMDEDSKLLYWKPLPDLPAELTYRVEGERTST